MRASIRPALEPLEDRFLPSLVPVQSLGAVAMADAQHALLHVQLIANKVETAGASADVQRDMQAMALLRGQGDVQGDEAALSALMQKAGMLNSLDVGTDAASFPILRALFPGAQ
jgi:hypothetical protein